MLSERSLHYVSTEEEKATASAHDSNAMMKEIDMERKRAVKITMELKKDLKVTDTAAELLKGQWWDRGPLCDLKDMLAKFS